MNNRADQRSQKLRERLRAKGDRLRPKIARLTRAALNTPDENAHRDCLAMLPAFVDAELEGARNDPRFAMMREHLDVCAECSVRYAELLEIVQAEQAGEILQVASVPRPDDSFLPRATREIVEKIAADILRALAPVQASNLRGIADAFFERLSALGGRFTLQSSAVQSLGLGPGEPGEALLILSASYATLEDVRASLSAPEIQALVAQNRWNAELAKCAQAAARRIGLPAALAEKFAAEFAARHSDPEEWQEWLAL